MTTAAPGETSAQAISVADLTETAKAVIEGAFPRLWVKGEVSNLTKHRNGHWYFSLRDAAAQLTCVVWARDTRRIPAVPNEGMEVMARGQERFNVFCSPCHGRTGEGNGMIVQRGFRAPPSFHEERLRVAPVGYYFDVMTNGFGAMQDYAAQVPVADRWAIAAYIRAIQLSHAATIDDVPADRRGELDQAQVNE